MERDIPILGDYSDCEYSDHPSECLSPEKIYENFKSDEDCDYIIPPSQTNADYCVVGFTSDEESVGKASKCFSQQVAAEKCFRRQVAAEKCLVETSDSEEEVDLLDQKISYVGRREQRLIAAKNIKREQENIDRKRRYRELQLEKKASRARKKEDAQEEKKKKKRVEIISTSANTVGEGVVGKERMLLGHAELRIGLHVGGEDETRRLVSLVREGKISDAMCNCLTSMGFDGNKVGCVIFDLKY